MQNNYDVNFLEIVFWSDWNYRYDYTSLVYLCKINLIRKKITSNYHVVLRKFLSESVMTNCVMHNTIWLILVCHECIKWACFQWLGRLYPHAAVCILIDVKRALVMNTSCISSTQSLIIHYLIIEDKLHNTKIVTLKLSIQSQWF